jgi:hypothetical protein
MLQMEPIKPIDIKDVRISGLSVIPTIDPPIVNTPPQNLIRSLEVPIIDVPKAVINYPIIDVPTQEEFDAAVRAENQKQNTEQKDKNRELPNSSSPQLPPSIQQTTQPIPKVEVPPNKPQPTFTVLGTDINLPDPSLVATAGAVAVVTTASTMVATTALNALKNAVEPLIKEATKNKFKIKIKQVKPVLHYVLAEEGHIDIFEYSSEGTKMISQTDNVEQYIRDQIEINALYEIDNKIIIDDVITSKFTKEGQQRFKPLFAPARKIAKKLGARLSF